MDSSPQTHSLERIRYRTLIASALFAVVGLVSLTISISLGEGYLGSLLRELTTLCLVGGALSAIYELYQRRDFLNAADEGVRRILDRITEVRGSVEERLRLAKPAEDIGLVDASLDSSGYDYGPLLEHAASVTIALNDGRTWVSTHATSLRRRFQDSQKTTTFILTHPESSMVAVLARKEGSNEAAIRNKIAETLAMIAQLRTTDTPVRVFGHFLFNPHSVFLADHFMVITPYFHGRGRRSVPYLRFDDRAGDSYFKETKADFETLLIDASGDHARRSRCGGARVMGTGSALGRGRAMDDAVPYADGLPPGRQPGGEVYLAEVPRTVPVVAGRERYITLPAAD